MRDVGKLVKFGVIGHGIGGFPLNISPLPTVQSSNPFSKSIHTYNFDKSVLFERPAIAYLIYDEKHGCFPSQKLVMCQKVGESLCPAANKQMILIRGGTLKIERLFSCLGHKKFKLS